jgi:hypothetical protein
VLNFPAINEKPFKDIHHNAP